jgi:hypothetical protein
MAALAITAFVGVQPAFANGSGCVTYVNYIYQANALNAINAGSGAAQGTGQTYSENVGDTPCTGRAGYAVEVSSSQFIWYGGWILCDQDYETSSSGKQFAYTTCARGVLNRNITGHRAWYFGNPYDYQLIYDV